MSRHCPEFVFKTHYTNQKSIFMKKILLAVTALLLVNAIFAQDYTRVRDMRSVKKAATTITGRETAVPENINPITRATSRGTIGLTFYDLQTNGSMSPRTIAHPDGTISAIWTTNGTTASSRGTGYNYYNGTSWVNDGFSTDRIENTRTGWGTITCVGDAEIVASHNGTTALVIGVCPQKGTQNWTFTTLQGPAVQDIHHAGTTSTCLLWPAIASSGNTIHLIACTESDTGFLYQGIQTCLLYYRGTFNASNNTIDWEQPRIVGNVTSSEVKQFSGDAYAIAAKGNTVAILNAPTFSDVFLWKSTDNGVNFTKTTVFQHPYPGFAENTTLVVDTPYVADGSCAVSIDDNGNAHVAFGITRMLNDVVDDGGYSYFPGVTAMLYWNETMSPILNTDATTLEPENIEAAGYKVFYRNDLTGDGHAYFASNADIPSYGVGAVSMPQIVNDNGNVYMIFTQLLDFPFLDVGTGRYYHGVFATKSTDNGNTWGGTSWLSYNKDCFYINDWGWTAIQEEDTFTIAHMRDYVEIEGESVFPAVAANIVNGKVVMTWQQDYVAGCAIKEDNVSMSNQESIIYYFNIDANEIGVYNNTEEVCQGLWIDHTGINNQIISGMKMYPNPATESVNITFASEETANAVISVMNLMGQTVYTSNVDVNEGYNMVTIPVNQFTAGVYMVNVRTEKGTSTQKLIVK